jgi:hypothetical protein
MAPLIPIALSLAGELAPFLIRHFTQSDTAADVAGQVVGIAKTLTGHTDPVQAVEALRADPALVLQFQKDAMALEAELDKAYLADRADARKRDIDVRKVSGGQNFRADFAVLAVVGGLIACLLVLVNYKDTIPGEVVGILSTIAGIFGACLKDYFAFEFGSSRSSRDKDITIASLSK